MNGEQKYMQYREKLPGEISVRHKITKELEQKRFHVHTQMEIVFIKSGSMNCQYENGILHIPGGSIVLFNTMNLHYNFSDPDGDVCDRYVVYFSAGYISGLTAMGVNFLERFLPGADNCPILITVPQKDLEYVSTLLDRMSEYYRQVSKGQDRRLHIQFLLGEYLLFVHELCQEQLRGLRIPQKYSHVISWICNYIDSHYEEEIRIDELCRLFYIGRTQLYQLFRQVSGMAVGEYIVEFRLTKAKNFLINTDWSVEIISQRSGYDNISSFSRAFKGKTGLSPLQYRKKYT